MSRSRSVTLSTFGFCFMTISCWLFFDLHSACAQLLSTFAPSSNRDQFRHLHATVIVAIRYQRSALRFACRRGRELSMAVFRSMMIVAALFVWLPLTDDAIAQQGAPASEQARREGEVIWYGTLTGGSIV